MSSGAVKRETHFVPVLKRQEETSGMLARVTLSRDLQVILQCLAKSASPLVQLQLSLRHRTDRDCLALLSEFSIVSRCQPVCTLRVSRESITRF
jgi:uncharacterized protein YutE (UPF0331/DUF86 family)